MADGVSQRQFFETMNDSTGKILKAVDKVGDRVGENTTAIGRIETEIKNQNNRIEKNEKHIEGAKNLNRIDRVVAGVVVAFLAWLTER